MHLMRSFKQTNINVPYNGPEDDEIYVTIFSLVG